MDPASVAILMLALFVVVIMFGFPIPFTLMAMGLGFGFIYYEFYNPLTGATFDTRIFTLFAQNTYGVMSSDTLVSIPLFLFMGYIVERTNIVDRLFTAFYLASWRLPGSLAIATLMTCALFATATGIVGAVVTLMGILALPQMLKANYRDSFASGAICAGGCLGILIPPSIMLIVYGQTASVSVAKLYAAALLPGFMLASMYVAYVVARAMLQPSVAPRPRPEDMPQVSVGKVLWMLLTSFVPLAFLILSVLGAIMFGIALPWEAAAVGCFGALLLAAAYRSLNWERLRESVYLTARTSAMVCWLFVGSATFAAVFAQMGGQDLIKDFVLSLELSPLMFLIMAQIIIFLLGYPLEWSEIIIIFVPIFLPLLPYFNIDPLLFGVLIALNLQTSFLTPPVAMSAFYLKGVAPAHVTLQRIYAGLTPYLGMVFLAMIVVYVFPEIALWLPSVTYGR